MLLYKRKKKIFKISICTLKTRLRRKRKLGNLKFSKYQKKYFKETQKRCPLH